MRNERIYEAYQVLVGDSLTESQALLLHNLLIRKTFNVFCKSVLKVLSNDISKTKGTFRGDLKADVHHCEKKLKKQTEERSQ